MTFEMGALRSMTKNRRLGFAVSAMNTMLSYLLDVDNRVRAEQFSQN
jgi:hypothetical protein